MFVTIDGDVLERLLQKARRAAALVPPGEAQKISSMTEAMESAGGLKDTELKAFRRMLEELCPSDRDDGAPPDEERGTGDEQPRQKKDGKTALIRLLLWRMQLLLERAEHPAKHRNIRLTRRR